MRRTLLVAFIAGLVAFDSVCRGQADTQAPASDADKRPRTLVLLKLTTSLLQQERDHPDRIKEAVRVTRAAIEEHYAHDAAGRADAHASLCLLVLSYAPALGIEEFKSLEAEPGSTPGEWFQRMRLLVAGACMDAGDRIEGLRQLDLIVSSPEATDEELLLAWGMRGLYTQDRADGLKCAEKATLYAGRLSLEGADFLSLMVRLRWLESDQQRRRLCAEVDDRARQMQDSRRGAYLSLTVGQAMLSGQLSGSDAVIESAAKRLVASAAPDPRQRLADLMLAVGATHKSAPDLAVVAGAEAEAFARRAFGEGSEELRVARLTHAKALRSAGRADALAPYADLDLAEQLAPGFHTVVRAEGDHPIVVIESYIKKRSDD